MKNYVSTENSLKRFLKRKVKITMGFMVSFLITGNIVFAKLNNAVEFINNDRIVDIKEYNISADNHYRGVMVGNEGKLTVTSDIINITNKTKGTGTERISGIQLRKGGKIDLGSNNADTIIIIETDSYAVGINTYTEDQSKTQEINLKGHKLTINSTSNSVDSYGIFVGDTQEKNTAKGSVVNITAKDTVINVKALDEEKRSMGLVALDEGIIRANAGNISITAKDAVRVSRKGTVEINKDNNIENIVKLNGNIVFRHDNRANENIDSNVTVNLANKDSEFNGRIYISFPSDSEQQIPDPEKAVKNLKLTISNEAVWNVQGANENTSNHIFGDVIVKDGGVINHEGVTYVHNNDKRDLGIQMQGGAILTGSGVIKSGRNFLGLSETNATNMITVSNKGNIINGIGEGLVLGRKVDNINNLNLLDNSELFNKGKLSMIGNILIGKEASFINEGTIKIETGSLINNGIVKLTEGTTINLAEDGKVENKSGAIIEVTSGATAVTGGKTINSGVISLKDTDNSDNTVSKLLSGGELTNKGTIALSDRTEKMTEKEWDTLLGTLVTENGVFTNTGMVVDKAGNSIFSEGTAIEGNTTTGELVDSGVADSGSIKIEAGKDLTISGTKTEAGTGEEAVLKDLSVNVEGNLTLAGNTTVGATTGVLIENVAMNVSSGKSVTVTGEDNKISGEIILNGESKLAVSDNADITLSGKVSQGKTAENKVSAIELTNGTLNLVDANIGVGIEGTGTVTSSGETSLKDITASEFTVIGEKETNTTVVDGTIKVNNIVVGKDLPNAFVLFADNDVPDLPAAVDELKLTSNSKFEEAGTLTIKETGLVTLAVDAKGNNALKNTKLQSGKVEVIGDNNQNTTDLMLETEKLSGTTAKIEFGDSVIVGNDTGKVTVDVNSDIYDIKNNELSGANSIELVYNAKLYEDNTVLNNINNSAAVVNDFFSQDTAERKGQLDKIYSSNIYSETVRAAYDNVKMNEEVVESLAGKSQVGKWTAEGKALYSKDEYDRKGTVGEYSSEIESTGLMAAFGYGVNETTTAGIAFSGVKQDVDIDNGSADADLFYLGVYGNKVVGNYDFTAGLGYQFGEYDADNTIANVHGSDKYDTQALSGYVQGRYTADLGDELSVQPKVKLGYTYIDQDNAKDSYFGVSDAEISAFDAEVGFDVVKSVQFEKSQADVRFGLSYTKAMGDTDKEFTGRFYGTEASNGFDVLGAELAENTVKFNLGAEVTNENGFFYNGGFTYEFGSDDTEAYGVNVGVGYKF